PDPYPDAEKESNMSATQTQMPVFVARFRRMSEHDETADLVVEGDPVLVDELIGRVLGRAHRAAERLDAPDEARAILHLAHSFAAELAIADPQFDRVRFIDTIIDMPS